MKNPDGEAGLADGSPLSIGPRAGAVPASLRPTRLFLAALFIAVLGLQLFLYRQSFGVKPSNDDFVALHQVDRGDTEGLSSFFHASNFDDYRPLMNMTVWLFGRISRRDLLLSLRVLHVLSFIFYASIAFLWIRALRLGRVAAVVAACVVFLHPTQAGALAGLDNFARFVVSAWVWLGAWVAWRWSGRPLLAVPLVALCLAIGLGYMEYAIALVPLATLVTVWPRSKNRVRNGSIMLLALAGVFLVYFLIRVSGRAATTSGAGFLSFDPLVWVKNAAMILVAELFFGNTVPVMIDRSAANLAWLGINVAAVAAVFVYGLWAARHETLPDPGEAQAGGLRTDAGRPPGLGLLGAACAVSFFPMVLMRHVSEIYVSSVTLGLALLAGLSTRGWASLSRPFRVVLVLFAGFQLLLSGHAIQRKVVGVKDGGERAEALIERVLEWIPGDASGRRIAIVFPKRDAGGAGAGYSVFALPDDQLILSGAGAFAIRWYRRDLDVRLDQFVVTDPSEVDGRSYDVVLVWNAATRQFSPPAPSGRRL